MNMPSVQLGIAKNQELADFWAANAREERRTSYLSLGIGAAALATTIIMVIQNNAEAAAVGGAISASALLHGTSKLRESAELRAKSNSFRLYPKQQQEKLDAISRPPLRLIVNNDHPKSS